MGAYEVTRSLMGVAAGVTDGLLDSTYDMYDSIMQCKDKILNYNSEDDTFTLPTDGNGNVIISQEFYDSLGNAADNGVARLDGYYLIEKKMTFNDWINNYVNPKHHLSEATIYSLNGRLLGYSKPWFFRNSGDDVYVIDTALSDTKYCFYVDGSGRLKIVYISDTGSVADKSFRFQPIVFETDSFYLGSKCGVYFEYISNGTWFPSETFQVFYTLSAAEKYLQGDRHYVPKVKIPSGGLTIPAAVINTNELGDIITKNIKSVDTKGLTQEEIQALIDAAVKEALDRYKVTATPIPTVPPVPTDVPTPVLPATGTPTPAPDYTSSLEDIYNWLVSSGKKQDAFESKISAYLEGNSKRLDSIVAILEDMLNKDPPKNCPYDYGELSKFLTSLWDRPDKKLDDVIKLLEENNSYQEKLLSSLNDIKALLVADTVLDTFKNRSSETADKAKEKFPLSIPWDVAMVINTMCAEPKTPVIRCPVVINSLSIREEIVIDLTDKEWEKLAETCRSLLSVTFVLYLVHLTRKMFFHGGDD